MVRGFVMGCVFFVCSAPVVAQQPSTCAYSACGLLRVGQDILAGQQRQEVASFGHFSPPDLRTLFQASDSAIHQLEIAEANYRSGKVLNWVGFAFLFASGFAYGAFEEPGSPPSTGEWAAVGIGLTGAGLSLWGGQRVRTARRAVDEGIWWYNGTLPRSP